MSVAYVVVAWLLAQVSDLALENFGAPDWVIKTVLFLLALGFPLAVFFAWAFELTPEGIKKEKEVDRSQSITANTGRKLDRVIIVVLALALGYFVVDRFTGEESNQDRQVGSEQAAGGQTNAVSAEAPVGAALQAAIDDKSLAVLPFAHRSPDPNDQYFTDGIHDDLLTQLAKQDAFKVISRTSVMEYRDTTKNMKQVGDELGVRNILEGGVQRAGSRVRINVQLIDAETDKHLWAETYDRELTTDNLFDIQSEITSAIATALQAELGDDPRAGRAAPTTSLAAYDLYHKAKQLTIGNVESEWRASVDMLEEATALDPEFALAHVGLAQSYLTLYWSFGGDPAFKEASREALDRAIAIDAGLPEIQMAEGFYRYWGFLDYQGALVHLNRAIELMPNNAEAHMWRGWTFRRAGRWDDALASMERSLELDPRAAFNWLEYGQTLGYVHRFDEALAAIEKTKSLGGLELWARGYMTGIYLQQGFVEAAIEESAATLRSNDRAMRAVLWEPFLLARDFQSAQQLADNWPSDFEINRQRFTVRNNLLAIVSRLSGDPEAARSYAFAALAELQAPDSKFPDDYRKTYALAQAYGLAGDRDNSVKFAEQGLAEAPPDAVENMFDSYAMARVLALVGEKQRAMEILAPLLPGPSDISVRFVELDPYWDGLRDDREFKALLDRYRAST